MTYAAAHNGGRSQVNLGPLMTGGDYSFLNHMKTGQAWSFVNGASAPVTPDLLDSDGYPTSIINSGVVTRFFVPTQTARPGRYVIKWDGNGTIYCGMVNTSYAGSKTSSGGSGRYEFSTTTHDFLVGVSSIGSPRITNIRVCHVDDEALLDAGEVFGTAFKAKLIDGGFGVIRFLNWDSNNVSNVTTWATRKPTSYVFYSGHELRNSIYTGLTGGSSADYTASLSGFALADKAMVHVLFDRSNSSACTLNVQSTGAKNILAHHSSALSDGGNTYPIGGTYRSLATLVYDTDLDSWIKLGGDAAYDSRGIVNGCPPELMVRLCAEIGAHPWFCAPKFACDPMTDWHTQLATYIRDNGPSWMIPRFEGPNELWNTFAGFHSTGYANKKATAQGYGTDDFHNWYGKVMSTIGQDISAVYAADRTKYHVICAGQTISAGGGSNGRLTSADYLAQAAPAQAGYTKSAAKDWVTHVAVANYFAPSDYGQAAETTAAANYAAESDPTAKQAIANTYAATANSGSGTFRLAAVATLFSQWKTWAQGHGINKMCCYEGGYSPDYTDYGNSDADRLRCASKNYPALQQFIYKNYRDFIDLTDDTFTAEFPSCYNFAFNINIVGYDQSVWSVLTDIYQTPEPPQWTAIKLFNQRKLRLGLTAS